MATSIATQYNISLIPWQSPVVYQGDEGSCGPCLTQNVLSLITNLDGQTPFVMDVQTFYNMVLVREHSLGHDIGVEPQLMLDVLHDTGASTIQDINYGLANISVKPTAADYTDALMHTITGYEKINLITQENNLAHSIAQFLLQGKPVLEAFNVTDQFEDQVGPLSHQGGSDFGTVLGGHYAEIVGCDTATNMLTLATWGADYGDKGYFQENLDSFYANKGGNNSNLQDLFVIDGFNGVDLTQNLITQEVAGAYIAVLGRAPELEGMSWFKEGMQHGQTLASVCDNLVSSAEFTNNPDVGTTNSSFVNYLFHNVLDRDVDSGGLAYYNSQLTAGMTKGQIAAEIITTIMDTGGWAFDIYLGKPSNDSNLMKESLLFNNKIQASEDYAITLQADSQHSDVAHNLLAHVTTDQGSIWGVALVGVPEQIGHQHIVGAIVS